MTIENTENIDTQYLQELFGLKGQVALITGARQGIGRTLALALARCGARVITTSRNIQSLDSLKAEFEELGAQHYELELDLRDVSTIETVIQEATAHWGQLDAIVNNSGTSVRKDACDLSVDDWNEVLDTNLRGTFFACQAAAGEMGERGGRIINLSSTYARVANQTTAPYAASKAAIEQLTRVLALEWASQGITVNAISPTTVITESRKAIFADESVRNMRIKEIPLGRLALEDDMVGAALLLLGKAGSFITGETILVDGGFSLRAG